MHLGEYTMQKLSLIIASLALIVACATYYKVNQIDDRFNNLANTQLADNETAKAFRLAMGGGK